MTAALGRAVRPPNRSLGRTLLAAIGVSGLGVLPVWLLSALAVPMGAELGFGEFGLGVAIATYFAISAVASVPAGRLVEHLGWVPGVTLTACVSAAGMLLVSVGARSWPLLIALLGVSALANGASQPAANLGLARAVPLHRQGLAFGLKQAAIPFSTLLVGLMVPLVGMTVGWRWAFAGTGLLALAIPLLPPTSQGEVVPARLHPTASPTPPSAEANPGLFPLIVLATGAGLATAATSSLGGFLVVYSVSRGLSIEGAGLLLACGSALGIVSRITTGQLADRRGRNHLPVVAMMMLGGGVGLGLLGAGGTLKFLVAGTILGFALGWSWNGLFALAIVLHYPNAPASATGVVQTMTYVGGSAGPLAFGIVAQEISFGIAWYGATTLLSTGAAMIYVGHRIVAAAERPSRYDTAQRERAPVPLGTLPSG